MKEDKKSILLNLTQEELNTIDEASKLIKRSRSNYIIYTVYNHAKKQLQQTNQKEQQNKIE